MMLAKKMAMEDQDDTVVEKLALQWLQRDPRVIMLVNGKLKLLWANHEAEKFLSAVDDLVVRNGALYANSVDKHSKLMDFIDHCGGRMSTLLLPSAGEGHLIVRAQLVGRDGDNHFFGIQPSLSIDYVPRYADLTTVFGLTKMEHQVLLDLLLGFTADEIAGRIGTAIGTIRTHIRHIYDKVAVTSREALFRAVAPYILQ